MPREKKKDLELFSAEFSHFNFSKKGLILEPLGLAMLRTAIDDVLLRLMSLLYGRANMDG